jgi:hypothetical protein
LHFLKARLNHDSVTPFFDFWNFIFIPFLYTWAV